MRAITRYESNDGENFATRAEAIARDNLVNACNVAMIVLPERRDIDSGRYVQRDRERCLQAKRNMLAVLRERFKSSDYKVFDNPDDDIHPSSFVGRLASECDGPISRAWSRLMCIDMATGREYDQPFFANNPGLAEGEQT